MIDIDLHNISLRQIIGRQSNYHLLYGRSYELIYPPLIQVSITNGLTLGHPTEWCHQVIWINTIISLWFRHNMTACPVRPCDDHLPTTNSMTKIFAMIMSWRPEIEGYYIGLFSPSKPIHRAMMMDLPIGMKLNKLEKKATMRFPGPKLSLLLNSNGHISHHKH